MSSAVPSLATVSIAPPDLGALDGSAIAADHAPPLARDLDADLGEDLDDDLDADFEEDLLFPDSDGKPMADSTDQFDWIVFIKENLEILFADDPQVFVAGDLLWYPVRSLDVPGVAPDVMVAFGVAKGPRGSYRQWQEGNIAPQVVVEIRSRSNTARELDLKRQLYETYGVEEYYLYDSRRRRKPASKPRFEGWQRQGDTLVKIASIDDWVSPRLGIRFVTQGVGASLGEQDRLQIFYPDGRPFLSPVQLAAAARAAEATAAAERQRAELAEDEADQLRRLLAQYQDRFGSLPPTEPG